VQVKQGENIDVTTSENLEVNYVKARNVQGQQVDLLPLPNNLWSLQNLVPGVYLLDVIVDMSSSGILGVYETVLVILQPDQTPLPPSSVINQVSIFIETEFSFENDEPRPRRNETDSIICTMEISYGQGPCDELYIPPDEDGKCPEGHRFVDERTGCVPNEFVTPPCSIDAQGNEVCPPTGELIPPICPLDAEGNLVCPPTDEPTPKPCPIDAAGNEVCPPTDESTPMPEPPPPECPDAGPEVCGEEPPPEEDPPGSGDNGENGNDNGNGNEEGESAGTEDDAMFDGDSNGENSGGESSFG
jgi:hypothetical protein